MNINRELFFDKAKAISNKILAIEASWDGGSAGWCVRLDIWTQLESGQYLEEFLGRIGHGLGEGHDYNRAFLGLALYPEVQVAQEIGQELAEYYAVPFYFASPDMPDIDLPNWLDTQDKNK